MTNERETADPWQASYEAAERRSFTLGLAATPTERIAWLEQALRLAHQTGALERLRAEKHREVRA